MWLFLVDLCPPIRVSATHWLCRNVPICLRNLQKNWCLGAQIEAEILTSQPPNVFAQFVLDLGASALPMGASTPPTWSRNVPMCLKTLQKYLMPGALIESEILSSPLPHVFAELCLVLWALVLHLWICQHLPSSLEMFLCVSETSKNLEHGVLIEAEILTSPSPMYLLNLAQVLDTSFLPIGGSTPPKESRNVFMCLRDLQKIWCMGP